MKELIITFIFITLALILAVLDGSWYAIGLQALVTIAIMMWQVKSYNLQ